MIYILISIFFLLILSAFFSGSETALTGASQAVTHRAAKKGDTKGIAVEYLLQRKEKLLTTILLGNNLVNILASSLATSLLIHLFGDTGVIWATLSMTTLVLIFAEILPKTLVLTNTSRAAFAVAPLLKVAYWILYPITIVLLSTVKIICKTCGTTLDIPNTLGHNSEEELRGAIDLHQSSKNNDEDTLRNEKAMLHSVLDLDDVTVGEIMVHRRNVELINADHSPQDILKQVIKSPYTRFPVYQNSPENIIGLLHAKKLLKAVSKKVYKDKPFETSILNLTKKPWFIPESTTLLAQLEAFRTRREHFSLVVNEYGSLMGIVTLEDILEEIVGDISDEYDTAVARAIRPQSDGSYIVKGDVTIRELNRALNWDIPDEEAATIAGLILYETRRIPKLKQSFLFHGFKMQITKLQRHRIALVKITPINTLENKQTEK